MRASNKYKLFMSSNPNSYISETYGQLRTGIQLAMNDRSPKALLITSTQPGEGKSTIAANLAVAYTLINQSVVLIDADLRRPTLHRYFKNSNQRGLSNALSGRSRPGDVAFSTTTDHLSIIPAGPAPSNPSELLASQRMGQLVTELKQQFDLVLIDSPPTLLASDTQILSRIVDGVVFVLNSGKVKKSVAQKALAKLEYAGANIAGIVLNNGARDKKEAYYYRS